MITYILWDNNKQCNNVTSYNNRSELVWPYGEALIATSSTIKDTLKYQPVTESAARLNYKYINKHACMHIYTQTTNPFHIKIRIQGSSFLQFICATQNQS